MAAVARKRNMTADGNAEDISARKRSMTADGGVEGVSARKRSMTADGGAEDSSPRKLRRGKERRVYSDDLLDDDADNYIDGQRSFDLQRESAFVARFVPVFSASSFSSSSVLIFVRRLCTFSSLSIFVFVRFYPCHLFPSWSLSYLSFVLFVLCHLFHCRLTSRSFY